MKLSWPQAHCLQTRKRTREGKPAYRSPQSRRCAILTIAHQWLGLLSAQCDFSFHQRPQSTAISVTFIRHSQTRKLPFWDVDWHNDMNLVDERVSKPRSGAPEQGYAEFRLGQMIHSDASSIVHGGPHRRCRCT